jgi:hypothetical protein
MEKMKVTFAVKSASTASSTSPAENFSRKYEIPTKSFPKVHQILTKRLHASYCTLNNTFLFDSREEVFIGLEKIIYLIVDD